MAGNSEFRRNPAATQLRTVHRTGNRAAEKGEVGISATNRNFKGRMGSRDAQCYLASPEVVAPPRSQATSQALGGLQISVSATQLPTFPSQCAHGRAGEILPGFPETVKGRLVFMPTDNVNTDAIYGKDYTYRDDMTAEMMARVIMENYDSTIRCRTRAGDIFVGGFNFGTGSSREQAVTCLKAKGIPLVIAASFSQTYLRNAYNNGFFCIEVPALIKRLREQFASDINEKEKTIVPDEQMEIDFTSCYRRVAGSELSLSAARQCAAVPRNRGRGGKYDRHQTRTA